MKITINHPSSSYGMPVILDDTGQPMDYADGVREIRARYKLNTQQFGVICGVSGRTVEGWEQGRPPSAQALLSIAQLINKPKRKS